MRSPATPARMLLGSLVALLLAAGCGSSGSTVEPEPDVRDYESFDPSPYEDREPNTQVVVVHDLPDGVLSGSTRTPDDSDGPRTVAGFRIQVGSDAARKQANEVLQSVELWMLAQVRNEEFESAFPLYIEWDQPYWKVRMGDFRSRRDALDVLRSVRIEFPGAFLVPSMITLE